MCDFDWNAFLFPLIDYTQFKEIEIDGAGCINLMNHTKVHYLLGFRVKCESYKRKCIGMVHKL